MNEKKSFFLTWIKNKPDLLIKKNLFEANICRNLQIKLLKNRPLINTKKKNFTFLIKPQIALVLKLKNKKDFSCLCLYQFQSPAK